MNPNDRFIVMIIFSFILFLSILLLVLGKSRLISLKKKVLLVALIVVPCGMLIGKFGANMGIPWWIYYPLPLLMNMLLPPLYFRMNKKQVMLYLILSVMAAPFIHFLFSFFAGWQEYMPFWKIPSLAG